MTLAICCLLSPAICHPPRSPIILIKIVRYTLVWTVDTYRDLEPGFSASKTAGTRAGGAPDSWVTMVIMNTRAGEERRQEVCDRR